MSIGFVHSCWPNRRVQKCLIEKSNTNSVEYVSLFFSFTRCYFLRPCRFETGRKYHSQRNTESLLLQKWFPWKKNIYYFLSWVKSVYRSSPEGKWKIDCRSWSSVSAQAVLLDYIWLISLQWIPFPNPSTFSTYFTPSLQLTASTSLYCHWETCGLFSVCDLDRWWIGHSVYSLLNLTVGKLCISYSGLLLKGHKHWFRSMGLWLSLPSFVREYFCWWCFDF